MGRSEPSLTVGLLPRNHPMQSLQSLNKGEKLTILGERWLAAVYSVTIANVYRFLIDSLEKNISPFRENTS